MSGERSQTLKKVQQMFNVSKATICRWTSGRGSMVVRIGGVVRIRESDLRKFVGRHEVGITVNPELERLRRKLSKGH